MIVDFMVQYQSDLISHFTELEMISRIWGTVLKDEHGYRKARHNPL